MLRIYVKSSFVILCGDLKMEKLRKKKREKTHGVIIITQITYSRIFMHLITPYLDMPKCLIIFI